MENIFLQIVNMSITASWLVLAVILLRFLFKKAPKWVMGVLWGFVALRLIFPYSFESVFSLVPSSETLPDDILTSKTPSINSGISAFNQAVNPVLSDVLAPDVTASANPMQILIFIASVIWLAGVVCMLIYTLISYVSIKRKVSEAVLEKDNIFMCDRVNTPFILGVIKPKIYLPSSINERDTQYVISHEKAHIGRGDYLWKPLGFVLLAVYWFNPLLWLAYILLCRDIELACDEKVVKKLGNEIKKPYSEALINCSVKRRTVAACPLAFGEVGVKDRVKSILNYKKPAFWVIIVAVVSIIVTAACLMTNPKSNVDLDDGLKVFLDTQIAEHHESPQTKDNFVTVDYEILKTDNKPSEVSVYMWVLYQEYSYKNDEMKAETGTHIPTVITAKKDGNSYELTEYWKANDGNQYVESIKEKFPFYLWSKATDNKWCIEEQLSRSRASAMDYYGISDQTHQIETDKRDSFLKEQIMEYNKSRYLKGDFATCDYQVMKVKKSGDVVTAYMWVLYQEYTYENEQLNSVSGGHCPTVITAKYNSDEHDYELTEYWEPENGTEYKSSIRKKFPISLWRKATDSKWCYQAQKSTCDMTARKYFGVSYNSKQEMLEDLEQYRTEYIGEVTKVVAIAQRLAYPQGYSYSYTQLQTSEEPYELIIYLDGERELSETDRQQFKSSSEIAMDLIGNMGKISFRNSDTQELIYIYKDASRSDADDWGILMSVNVKSARELTIEILRSTQFAGREGEMITGDDYEIKAIHNGKTMSFGKYMRDVLKYDYLEPDLSWNAIAYGIEHDKIFTQNVDLDYTYGKLPVGKYILSKTLTNTSGDGSKEKREFTCTFEITEDTPDKTYESEDSTVPATTQNAAEVEQPTTNTSPDTLTTKTVYIDDTDKISISSRPVDMTDEQVQKKAKLFITPTVNYNAENNKIIAYEYSIYNGTDRKIMWSSQGIDENLLSENEITYLGTDQILNSNLEIASNGNYNYANYYLVPNDIADSEVEAVISRAVRDFSYVDYSNSKDGQIYNIVF